MRAGWQIAEHTGEMDAALLLDKPDRPDESTEAIPNVGRGRGLLLSRRGARRRGDGEHETIQPNGDRLEGRRHRGYLTVTCPNIQGWGVQK